ncbi:bifunctional oligoribonuclease/PAP phosphatase NrnA [bacterium]|nr:bifunctional oligoribonuclease/PAP phosphatase NrnA [candidate division CSSED10-310 bacterium]
MPAPDEKLKTLIREAGKFLVTTHIHPDGDAAGSSTALALCLRKNNASVDLVLATEIGERFRFLFKGETVLSPEQMQTSYDAAFILDVGSEDRTGFHQKLRELNCPLINIDHHVTNEGFADYDILDPDASSTCELLYRLMQTFELPVDAEIACRLYVGILTDSRFFQNVNVRPETFQTARELLSTGLDHAAIVTHLTQSRSLSDLKVLGLGLSNCRTRANGKIIYTIYRNEDFLGLNAEDRHAWSAGIFSHLISLKSALVSASFIESDRGKTFCEFRSKSGFDVSVIAARFGGGGHRSASGCSVSRPVSEFSEEVLNLLESEVRQYLRGKPVDLDSGT